MLPDIKPATLDQAEAAKFLGISAKHFRKLAAEGRLPAPLDLGGRLRRYHIGTLEQWLRDGGCRTPGSTVQTPA